jgi:hypothetical protein
MEHIRTDTRKARKEHECWGCCKKIPKGMKHIVHTCSDGGQVSTARYHDECSDFLGKHGEYLDEGVMNGEVLEILQDMEIDIEGSFLKDVEKIK